MSSRLSKYFDHNNPDDFFYFNDIDLKKRKEKKNLLPTENARFRWKLSFFIPLFLVLSFMTAPFLVSQFSHVAVSNRIYSDSIPFSGQDNSTSSKILKIKVLDYNSTVSFNLFIKNKANLLITLSENKIFEYYINGKLDYSLQILQISKNINESLNTTLEGLSLQVIENSLPLNLNRIPAIIYFPYVNFFAIFGFVFIFIPLIFVILQITYTIIFGKQKGYNMLNLKELFGSNVLWFNTKENPISAINYKQFFTYEHSILGIFKIRGLMLTFFFLYPRYSLFISDYYILNLYSSDVQIVIYLITEIVIFYILFTFLIDFAESFIIKDFVDSFILTPEGIYLFYFNSNEYTFIKKNEHVIFQIVENKKTFPANFLIENDEIYFTFKIKSTKDILKIEFIEITKNLKVYLLIYDLNLINSENTENPYL